MIRAHLMAHGSIDKPTALRLCGCDRLGARIWDLRHSYGMNIRTERVIKRNALGHHTAFAAYHYDKEEQDNG